MNNKKDVGILGLGVMGRGLAINILREGFSVSVYNRYEDSEKDVVSSFLKKHQKKEKLSGTTDISLFVLSLSKPRKIILMVKSGAVVDDIISTLTPLLDKGDIVIDFGNSHYLDTIRRGKNLKKYGLHYLGCGISGGWRGAKFGASIMAGGSEIGWNSISDILYKISAKNPNGKACCNFLGFEGSGHLIKMVHNGIEYAMMQSIAEVYDFMHRGMRLSNDDISSIFSDWDSENINSYLINITSKILTFRKENISLVDLIVDKSMQKGTGKDFSICALQYGVATPTITEAVNARFLSNIDRSKHIKYSSRKNLKNIDHKESIIVSSLKDSIYCSYMSAIIQGIALIEKVSSDYLWNIDIQKVLSTWEEGCVIKSSILNNLKNDLNHGNLFDVFLKNVHESKIHNLRSVILLSSKYGIPMPVGSSALSYYLSLSSVKFPSNLIQLQREYFGSHGFEILNDPGIINHLYNENT